MVYLSVPGLKALGWTFVAIDVLLTAGRFVIRWLVSGLQNVPPGIRRFNIDDGIHVFALVAATTYVALQTSGLDTFIRVEEFTGAHRGHVNAADESRFFHIRFGAVLIFWIGLYSVKFSFLALYRSLFWVSQPFQKAWWAVLASTAFSFSASFVACFWVCGYPIHPTNLKSCLNKKTAAIENDIEYVWCALSAMSSILVLLLPIFMIRSLKMRLAKKLSLSALFAIGIIDIFFDIFRTFYTTTSVGVQNLWEILEITIAVMLSALIAYRQIFTLREKISNADVSRERLTGYKPSNGIDSVNSDEHRTRAPQTGLWFERNIMKSSTDDNAIEEHSLSEITKTDADLIMSRSVV